MNMQELLVGSHDARDLHRWDEITIILGLAFISLLTLDYLTTTWSISLGAVELNKLIAPIVPNLSLFTVVRFCQIGFFITLTWLINFFIRGAGVWCFASANIVALIAVINNVIVLTKLV